VINLCKTPPTLSGKQFTFGHCRNLSDTLAAACVQAEAILTVAEYLAAGCQSAGAFVACNSAAQIVSRHHHRHWANRMVQESDTIRLINSFGDKDLLTPYGLESSSDGFLWATSLGGERISKFSSYGDLVQHLQLPGSRPWGLFQAGRESLWVCDLANPYLLRVRKDGIIEHRLHIRNNGQDLRPILGTADGNVLYLILANSTGRNRQLARIHADDESSLEILPCPTPRPSGIRVHAGRLYLSSQNPPALLSQSLDENKIENWTNFNNGMIPDFQNHFVFTDNHVWLTAMGRLTRLNVSGEVELVIDAASLVGYPDSNFRSLTILDTPGSSDGSILFVSDKIHNLIHSFKIY